MRISSFPKRTALLAGLAALGVALPLVSSQAGEPMRLDAVQMDSVTAGAISGFTLNGAAQAWGTVGSEASFESTVISTSNPSLSVTKGVAVAKAIGIGGVAPPPSATASVGATNVVGQKVWTIPINVRINGSGFFSAQVAAVGMASVASEFPIF